MWVFLKYPLKLKAIVETPGKRADRAVTDPCGMCHKWETAALILSKNT